MRCYSYIRWSKEAQGDGDSLRRQTDAAAAYAKQRNLTLDNATYTDKGISAFRGKNAAEGALGAFLQAIDAGSIKTPCTLLVENLDRITRLPQFAAMHLITGIVMRGVTVVTLQDGRKFHKDDTDIGASLTMLLGVNTANSESAKKSKRLLEVFAQHRKLRETGIITTRYCPVWLTVNEDKTKFLLDRSTAAIIKRMFKLSIEGYGVHKIAQIFNDEKVKMIGRQAIKNATDQGLTPIWKSGHIAGFLRQEAVTGTFVTRDGKQRIPGYYQHQLVSPADFKKVQYARTDRRNSGGSRRGTANLFALLTKCASCGTNMKFTGATKEPYLYCLNRLAHGGCTAKAVRYKPFESDLVSYLLNWAKRDLQPHKMDSTNKSRRAELKADVDAQLEIRARYVRAIAKAPDVDALAEKLADVQKQIDALQAELSALEINPRTPQEIEDMVELMYDLTEEPSIELRLKVQVALRQQIQRIEVSAGSAKIYYRDGSVGETDIITEDRRKR